jgi:hypothetical protein
MISIFDHLPWKRYLAALIRIRDQIKNGSKLELDDSDEPGDRHTHASWGLCSGSTEQWPDQEDRLFTRDYPLAILHQGKGQLCPFDKTTKNNPDGCFFRCRIFQHLKDLPSREEALRLYESRIKEVQKDSRLDQEPKLRD